VGLDVSRFPYSNYEVSGNPIRRTSKIAGHDIRKSQ
jgi:hypothetical protein